MIRRVDLSGFRKRSDLRSTLVVTAHLLLVLAPVYAAAFIGPSIYLVAMWLCFGLLMNGVLNLMHECAHYHVFKTRGKSDLLGRWIVGPLAFADFDSYRARHWKHHTHLGTAEDTKDAYLVDIRGPKLIGFLLRCLILSEALLKFRHQTGSEKDTKKRPSDIAWLGRTVLFQALWFMSLVLVAGPLAGRPWERAVVFAVLAYSFVYVYGLASITVFAATLRAVAEHQVENGQTHPVGRATLRNFRCGVILRIIFGAYGFAEHATHHREPSLPYYHLTEVTRELAGEDPILLPSHGYLTELATLVSLRQ